MNFAVISRVRMCARVDANIVELNSSDPVVYNGCRHVEACGSLAVPPLISVLKNEQATDHLVGTVAGILCRLRPPQSDATAAPQSSSRAPLTMRRRPHRDERQRSRPIALTRPKRIDYCAGR
jgi:hypothetical protein